jgi:GNAT superfamily N-acetyltransferase
MADEMNASIRLATPDDAPGIARVHIDSWRTTYPGIVPDDVLVSLSYEQREQNWRMALTNPESKQFIYVAVVEGEVVGFAASGPGQENNSLYSGEIYALYLFEEWQGRGIGRELVKKAAQELLRRGHKSMLIWVLRDNPSRGFYERMGGKYYKEKPIQIGDANLIEVAYGWNDLTTLNISHTPTL